MTRVLLIRVSSMGDIVHTLPALTQLQLALPHAQIDWLCEPAFVDIPAMHPFCHEVIPFALRRWRLQITSKQTWHEITALKKRLRDAKYDLVIDLSEQLKTAVVARWTRSPCVVGFDAASVRERTAGWFYTHGVHAPRSISSVLRYRTMVAGAVSLFLKQHAQEAHLTGVSSTPPLKAPPDFGLQAPALTAPWLPDRYAVFNTCASRDDKLWPAEHWVKLASTQALPVVLTWGSAAEQIRVASLAQQLPYAIVAPALSLRQAAQLFSGARWVVGVDSGLTHLAAALGRLTVGVYCASNPQLTPVVGSPGLVLNVGQSQSPPSVAAVRAALDQVLSHNL